MFRPGRSQVGIKFAVYARIRPVTGYLPWFFRM
jgi:hypothetical protein